MDLIRPSTSAKATKISLEWVMTKTESQRTPLHIMFWDIPFCTVLSIHTMLGADQSGDQRFPKGISRIKCEAISIEAI